MKLGDEYNCKASFGNPKLIPKGTCWFGRFGTGTEVIVISPVNNSVKLLTVKGIDYSTGVIMNREDYVDLGFGDVINPMVFVRELIKKDV